MHAKSSMHHFKLSVVVYRLTVVATVKKENRFVRKQFATLKHGRAHNIRRNISAR